ncbi:hypothetical protein JTE90_029306 [Oedothorax gibbosus]|uniref:Uncharacterized protein n=1 Tax=Oedothorax gibbosus TaxID=931172 RepID=A0AAV6TXT8_9ARAC|nr:hypothetical protein JTE90_029306 [Oedothorax gibbosus]
MSVQVEFQVRNVLTILGCSTHGVAVGVRVVKNRPAPRLNSTEVDKFTEVHRAHPESNSLYFQELRDMSVQVEFQVRNVLTILGCSTHGVAVGVRVVKNRPTHRPNSTEVDKFTEVHRAHPESNSLYFQELRDMSVQVEFQVRNVLTIFGCSTHGVAVGVRVAKNRPNRPIHRPNSTEVDKFTEVHRAHPESNSLYFQELRDMSVQVEFQVRNVLTIFGCSTHGVAVGVRVAKNRPAPHKNSTEVH